MSPRGWPHLVFLALALSSSSCTKEDKADRGGAVQPASTALTPPPPAQPNSGPALSPEVPQTQLGDVPTPEDLEAEAQKTIAVDNLEAELDRLEAEIMAGP